MRAKPRINNSELVGLCLGVVDMPPLQRYPARMFFNLDLWKQVLVFRNAQLPNRLA